MGTPHAVPHVITTEAYVVAYTPIVPSRDRSAIVMQQRPVRRYGPLGLHAGKPRRRQAQLQWRAAHGDAVQLGSLHLVVIPRGTARHVGTSMTDSIEHVWGSTPQVGMT